MSSVCVQISNARAMSADEGTRRLAVEYLAWMVPAMALQFLMVAMGAALRGSR